MGEVEMANARRELTEATVLSLFLGKCQGVRLRSDLEAIRIYGLPERTAADLADVLATRGLIEAFGGEGDIPHLFAITAKGREAYSQRPERSALQRARTFPEALNPFAKGA